MIYGCYGYTGRLFAKEAQKCGHMPVLAGRNHFKTKRMAEKFGYEYRVFNLNDSDKTAAALEEIDLVYHIAGPYAETSEPMIKACLETSTHYLDLTGEIPVVLNGFRHNEDAVTAGIAIINSCGFNSLTTDCISSIVAERIDNPVKLEIGIDAISRPSAGTFKGTMNIIADEAMIYQKGELKETALAGEIKKISFPGGKKDCIISPMADLPVSHRSTGIDNINVWLAMPSAGAKLLKPAAPLLKAMMKQKHLRKIKDTLADIFVKGPDEKMNRNLKSYITVEAENEKGETARGTLETPEAYYFTSVLGVRCVESLLSSNLKGAMTPVQAFGKNFVLQFKDVKIIR